MIPHPMWFTGSLRQRRAACDLAWREIVELIEREVLFTLGHTPLSAEANRRWRAQIAQMSRSEVRAQIRRVLEVWPARKIRS